jgi:sugar/nucleoside kinase (ribokinase family)
MNGKFKGNKILFVGLNTVDLQFVIQQYPKVNTKSKAQHSEIHTGGPATNAAVTCAHLGEKVDLFTPVGQHVFSEYIIEDIRQYGIHIIDPAVHESAEPVFASIVSSSDTGERNVFSYYPKIQYDIYDNINLEFNDYKLVMFDGFYSEFAIPIAKECRARNITTVLDGGSWKPDLDKLLVNIDIALCSNDFYPPGIEQAHHIFRLLHDKGVEYCAITRGEKSILYSENGIESEIAIPPVMAIDTLGAGDVFHGAFCYYYVNGFNFTDSLTKASFVAGESCKSIGARNWTKKFLIDNSSL